MQKTTQQKRLCSCEHTENNTFVQLRLHSRSFHRQVSKLHLRTSYPHNIWHFEFINLQISEEDAKRIVDLTFVDLSKELHDGKITATKALHAYQYKVMLENPAINFMCEPIMEAKVRLCSALYILCCIVFFIDAFFYSLLVNNWQVMIDTKAQQQTLVSSCCNQGVEVRFDCSKEIMALI